MRVLKFGGTSLSHAQRLDTVVERVRALRGSGATISTPVVVVVSALGGVTDELTKALESAERGEPSPGLVRQLRSRHLEDPGGRLGPEAKHELATELDGWLRELERLLEGVAHLGETPAGVRHRVLATGERLSAPRVAAWLRADCVPATVVDGTKVLRADYDFSHPRAGAAQVDQRATRRQVLTGLRPLNRGEVPVVTGFLAAEAQGRTVTLGRGASDLSATTLAAALEADVVEIWTDTDGVLSADPRRVPSAVPLRTLSFEQAATLARYGAKVLHPETLAPVRTLALPIQLRSTLQPELPGTLIGASQLMAVNPLSAAKSSESAFATSESADIEAARIDAADSEIAAEKPMELSPEQRSHETVDASALSAPPGIVPERESPGCAASTLSVVRLTLRATPWAPLGSTVLSVLEHLRLEPLQFGRSRGQVQLWLRADEAEAVEIELRRSVRSLRASLEKSDELVALALLPGALPAAWLAGDLARLLTSRGFRVHDLFVDPAVTHDPSGEAPKVDGVVVAVVDPGTADLALLAVHDTLVAPPVVENVDWAASG